MIKLNGKIQKNLKNTMNKTMTMEKTGTMTNVMVQLVVGVILVDQLQFQVQMLRLKEIVMITIIKYDSIHFL